MSSALEAQLIAAGVTMEVETVPQQVGSLKDAMFQFIITIRRNHDIWTGPYSMGYGHYPFIEVCYVPGSRTRFSVDGAAEILRAVNNNRRLPSRGGEPIVAPTLGDVMENLLEDAGAVLDGLTFIHWCQEYDMNPDSIKDKATYEKCLDIGLRLVRGFGATELLRLRELTQE